MLTLSRATYLRRLPALLLSLGIFAIIFRRIPFDRLLDALREAEYGPFLLLMTANTVFYFCWDTLILTCVIRWFHAPVTYRELLPVRAASYVIAFFNVNVGRGALAAYLSRRLGIPFLQIGSTVLFLLLTEYTHLVVWGIVGLLLFRSPVAEQLWWGPLGVAALWLTMVVARSVMGGWSLLRTFRMAPPLRYLQVVLLRVPMFAVSLCLHFLAARTFGLEIPFGQMLTFLPLIFMIAALPITIAHLGSTQAAWLFFFSAHAPPPKLLAFSLAAHLTFMATRALLGLAFLPRAYSELAEGRKAASLLAQRA